MSSEVSHPAHYNSGKIEVIEAIEDWKLNYHRGNAVKYIARAGKKDPAKEAQDLEKAIWYLQREVELLTKAKPCRPNDMIHRVSTQPLKGNGLQEGTAVRHIGSGRKGVILEIIKSNSELLYYVEFLDKNGIDKDWFSEEALKGGWE